LAKLEFLNMGYIANTCIFEKRARNCCFYHILVLGEEPVKLRQVENKDTVNSDEESNQFGLGNLLQNLLKSVEDMGGENEPQADEVRNDMGGENAPKGVVFNIIDRCIVCMEKPDMMERAVQVDLDAEFTGDVRALYQTVK
jgi:hypothetical protein